MTKLAFLTDIPENEKKDFDAFIQATRREFISTPNDTVKSVLVNNKHLMSALKSDQDVSNVIRQLREKAFDSFLVSEAEMNAYILKHISQRFSVPEEKFN